MFAKVEGGTFLVCRSTVALLVGFGTVGTSPGFLLENRLNVLVFVFPGWRLFFERIEAVLSEVGVEVELDVF